MTQQQFIQKRQTHSEVSWNDILASGYDALPCDCGLQGCDGWKLAKVAVANQPMNHATPLQVA